MDKIIKDLEKYKDENQNKIYELEREVELLSTELKMYKLKQDLSTPCNGVNTLHILILKQRFYSGMDNETCLGVFTNHSTLLFHLTKILKKNIFITCVKKLQLNDFKDITISLKNPINPSLSKDLDIKLLMEEIEHDDEYHTSILGLEVNTVKYFIDGSIEEPQLDIFKEPVILDKFLILHC